VYTLSKLQLEGEANLIAPPSVAEGQQSQTFTPASCKASMSDVVMLPCGYV
jgi:hypothetical protein